MGAGAQVGTWLHGLGLSQYEQAFRDNDIDDEVLPELTAEDLKEIGISSVGHRRKLLAAIAALRGSVPLSSVASFQPRPELTTVSVFPAPPREAERRQLTVMFADLVGSTALASRLDPEDLREVIGAYHRCVTETVARYDGFVAKYMGDGVLVYFGYPHAHEDDAERAVQAGIEIPKAVGQLTAEGGTALAARVGIATGHVVVGDLIGSGAAQEQAMVGETPNLAARLQVLAEPNAVVIAESTRRLLGDLFECRDLGAVAAKGFAGPITAWQVLRASTVESRFDAFHAAALTPMVGREEELELLLRRWRQATAGDGQVVLLSGEPGIGKSRLTRAIRERISGEPHVRLLYFCSPHHQASVLFPFISHLERAAGFVRDDPPERRLKKLEALLAQSTNEVTRDAAVLAELLSIPTESRYPPRSELSPHKRKETTLTTLLAQLDGLAARQPVLIIFEDAQWIDPTSRELLELIIDRVQHLPVLLVVTFRPEFQPPWVSQPHVTMHPLTRLDRREASAMIERLTGGKTLPQDLLEQIISRTDGVPLFVEELTKTMLESDLLRSEGDQYVLTAPLPMLAIPSTLHASLMARLDRLPIRKIAEVGAAIGRDFSHELIAAVSGEPESDLNDALQQLVASELVYRRGMPPDAVYSFKHALVQDAAYSTLLRSARQQLHTRIAKTLEERFPETADTQPELVAHHFAEAGRAEQAIAYWRRAGKRASERSAHVEAVAHLSKGLALIETLPDTSQRAEAELKLQLEIGGPLISTQGYAAAEVERTYLRARELCERLGCSSELFPALRGLWHCYIVRGQLPRAYDLAEQLVALAEEQGEPLRRALAARALGSTLFFFGRFNDAREQLDQGITFDEAAAAMGDRRTHILLYADVPGVVCRLHLSCTRWQHGFPDRALPMVDAALALSQSLSHSPSVAFSLNFAAIIHCWRREFDAARQQAEAAIAVARKYSFPQWLAMGTMCRGFALANLGQPQEGLMELHTGLAGWHGTGARLYDTMWLGFTAEAHTAAGQLDAAFTALDRATEIAATNAETFYQAELHRLRSVAHLGSGEPEEAKRWLSEAIALARSQGARSLELRAATSLARLWYTQGRRDEAHDLLAPIYGWFTEGFETLDLKEAAMLLGDLASTPPGP
jgi:class 3 adenylate cyclase/predicted ATPase